LSPSAEAHHEKFIYYFKHIEGHAITDGLVSVPKPQATGRAVKISFHKPVDFSVRLYRVDDSGHLKFRTELRSFNSAAMNTFAGETWVVTDIGDQLLYCFVAQQKSAENAVNLARIPPALKGP
jgi:hypothetical protein